MQSADRPVHVLHAGTSVRRLLLKSGIAVKAPGTLPGLDAVAAIGDIHGEFDLLLQLLARIKQRAKSLCINATQVRLIVLGDFIDKGPDANRVLNYLYLQDRYARRMTVLRGNHEQLLLDCIANPDLVPRWLDLGGWQTVESYGADPRTFVEQPRLFPDFALDRIGNAKLAWLGSLQHSITVGDYFFCHAGVRPGVALSAQDPNHLMWIRDEFLDSKADHGAVIVHGHAEEPRVTVRSNRIGLDTCAWKTGHLSAALLTGSKVALVEAKRRVNA